MSKYCVSLGASAEIWAHRGHKVVGGVVYCDSLQEACEVACASVGDGGSKIVYSAAVFSLQEAREVARASVGDAYAIETVGSGVFFWRSHEKYLADEDCLSPDAVVMEVEE